MNPGAVPPTQYRNDQNLRARQRLWEHQIPPFDLVEWVLNVASASLDGLVLDVGCGNGAYLRRLRERGARAVGVDRSIGMLQTTRHPSVINGDVHALPVATAVAKVVLAAHMLYHADDPTAAALELRRVLSPGGVCIVVTNGKGAMGSVRRLLELAVHRSNPGWVMRSPSTHVFSLDNGADVLAKAFDDLDVVRPVAEGQVRITDPSIVADYVASMEDVYQSQISQPWVDVVENVRHLVAGEIGRGGYFPVKGDVGAFVCR